MPSVQAAQVQVHQANESRQEADNVAFAGVLSALALHEVLANYDRAELVAFEAEPRHVVEDREDDTASANDEHSDGDTEPDPLVHEDRVNSLDEVHQEREDDSSDDVLRHNRGEGVLDLDVGTKMIVDEVDLLLCVIDLIASDVPLLFFGKEALTGGVAFEVHSAHGQVRNSPEAVMLENRLDVCVLSKVQHAEKDILLTGEVLVDAALLNEGEDSLVELGLDRLTQLASLIDSEKHDDVVRPRILQHELAVLTRRELNDIASRLGLEPLHFFQS